MGIALVADSQQVHVGETTEICDSGAGLYRDKSFWGMTVAQFFGAFNDNLFKQLVLLLAIGAAAGADDPATNDRQGLAMLVFAVPCLLFSGLAGYLADRISKRSVIVAAKFAEMAIMALGVIAFSAFGQIGLSGLLVVLFLMGMQSAFFGPSKYGILPEMLPARDLPRANGFFLMTTFLAIIFGTAMAGVLKDEFGGRLWMGSLVCVAIAAVGTSAALLVRRLPAAQPNLRLQVSSFTVPGATIRMLRRDHALIGALTVASAFWLMGGIVQPGVNSLGKVQLQLAKDAQTSSMAAAMGVGIAVGCFASGYLSRGRVNFRLMRIGSWGLIACLVLLWMPPLGGMGDVAHRHLLGYPGSIPVLVGLGTFAGMFVVPVQVFLQSRPPEGLKGRMIALMNQCSWIGIVISALLYMAFDWLLAELGWPRSTVFLFTAVMMLPIALLYHPSDEQLRN